MRFRSVRLLFKGSKIWNSRVRSGILSAARLDEFPKSLLSSLVFGSFGIWGFGFRV